MYKVDPPIEGQWPFEGFPEAVTIDDTLFVKAIRKQAYDGVAEQYRQDTPKDSAHLLVKDDGTYIIDHVDEYNPDRGFPARHWLVDHPKGVATAVMGAGALGVIASSLMKAKAAKTAEKKPPEPRKK